MARRRRAAPAPVRRRTSRTAPAAGAARTPPEARLLELARALGEIARREPPARALTLALDALARADAWETAPRREASGARPGDDARLAQAWAREQVRVALVEILAGASRATAPGGRADSPSRLETRAWLLLAAAEALAREPAGAGADRWRDVLEVIGGAAPPG